MFPFEPPENIRKPKVDQKGTLGRKGLMKICRSNGFFIFTWQIPNVFTPKRNTVPCFCNLFKNRDVSAFFILN